ncbi:hypothetical protein NLJ89_g11143 [Agrocybe chaxingu]|uniref:HAT C-terminal dimerisation domain-containing protein n=1 Tax=Agrocybe chaxingu TaxID=84603 RepID=A0A9W8MNA0_9AGAR|nr:hypothetical protein NLJ89_g11143 [Agrocybe chaxingu]
MAPPRGERDKVDTTLIVEGSRTQKARTADQAYPTPLIEATKAQEIASLDNVTSEAPDGGAPKPSLSITIPEGEAVNADGTLKDASEMDWLHSPSDEKILEPSSSLQKRAHSSDAEGESEMDDDSSPSIQDPKVKRRRIIPVLSSDDDTPGPSKNPPDKQLAKTTAQVLGKGKTHDKTDEEEDEDEGTKAYNKLVKKMSGKIPRKSEKNKDLHLCFAKDVRKDGQGKAHAGEYCKFCLEDGVEKRNAFLTGNVTSKRCHIACTQKAITGYTVKTPKTIQINKSVLSEMILGLIADADLSFRFVERPLFRHLILMLNPKLSDKDIPKKDTIANMVLNKVSQLDLADIERIKAIPSRISGVYDGWSTQRRRPYSSFSISYIHSPPDDDTAWELKTHLLDFSHVVGRHTGELIGQDLTRVVKKFNFGDKTAASGSGDDEEDIEVEDFDVDISMDVEATADDVEAILASSVTDFDAGDVVGKLMAFLNQVRMSSEGTRDILKECCHSAGCKSLELKLWVRTRWGSLSDCFEVTLGGADAFCGLADSKSSIPPLTKGKKWKDYLLTESEWTIVQLAYDCLKVPASVHVELSSEKVPTAQRVLPHIERLQSDWEEKLADPEYAPVAHALEAGLANMLKWYRKTDDTSIYFVCHVIDPTIKRSYVDVAWDKEWVDAGMKRFNNIFLKYKAEYDKTQKVVGPVVLASTTSTSTEGSQSRRWMDKVIKSRSQASTPRESVSTDPLAEVHKFFQRPPLSPEECPNTIAWFGLQKSEFPVIRMMAHDYLAIPASSCLAERSFSMSARTDDSRCGQMKHQKFGGLQRLRDAYQDGRLVPEEEALNQFLGDFSLEFVRDEE